MGVVEQYRAGPPLEQVEHPGVAGGMVADGVDDAIEAGAVPREPVSRTDRQAGLCQGEIDPLLPNDSEKRVVLQEERIRYWLGQGAQVTDRVARFLDRAGILPGATRMRGTGKKAAEIAAKKAAAEAAAAEKAA